MWLWLMWACSPGDVGLADDTFGASAVEDTQGPELPEDTPAADLVDPTTLDALLHTFVAEHAAAASACVTLHEETLWCGAAGLADVEAGREATPDTPFLLASLSKAWVGAAVARLLQEGAIDLDDAVEPLLGFRLGTRHNAAITWRTLVTHTSTIRDDWAVMDRHYTAGDSPEALGDFLRDYLDPEGREYRESHFADHAPGERLVYSNIGTALTAFAVERATGEPFDGWCEAHLFNPLGLEHTHWHLSDFPPDTVALPYERRRGAWVSDGHYGFPDYPDGQLRSSAREVATFLGAIASGGGAILSGDGVTALLRPPLPQIDPAQAVFWYGESRAGAKVWGHNGGEVGASTDAFFDPVSGAGFVLLVNSEPPPRVMLTLEAELLRAGQAAGRP